MGLGQAAVEALCVSLIFDMLPMAIVPVGESFLYVGVYIGELVSANLSVAFPNNWRATLKGVGITGFVISFALAGLVRQPARRSDFRVLTDPSPEDDLGDYHRKIVVSKGPDITVSVSGRWDSLRRDKSGDFRASLLHIVYFPGALLGQKKLF